MTRPIFWPLSAAAALSLSIAVSSDRHFSEQEIAFFLNVDFVSHVALVAVIDEGGRPVIIAAACADQAERD
jgi:hypothetical protein